MYYDDGFGNHVWFGGYDRRVSESWCEIKFNRWWEYLWMDIELINWLNSLGDRS